MTPFLLLRLEGAAGVRQESGDAEVTGGDLTDTCSSSWRTRPARPGAEATPRSSGATRKEQALVRSGGDNMVESSACRRASASERRWEWREPRWESKWALGRVMLLCFQRVGYALSDANGRTRGVNVPLQFSGISQRISFLGKHSNLAQSTKPQYPHDRRIIKNKNKIWRCTYLSILLLA
jgi:hypothetical protein